MKDFQDWIKAGEIAGKARDFGAKLIKKGEKLIVVTEKVEEKIKELGGELAFPTQISRNEVAAHYNAIVNDETVFGNDVVKIDVGVQINGAIGDTATTVDLTGENQDLVDASRDALNNALKVVKAGVTLKEVGKVIQETISSAGFAPVRNLCGHGLDIYKIHDVPSVPNFDNGDETVLKEGQTIAIEPFASKGSGIVVEGKKSEIYRFLERKPTRNPTARKVMAFVEKEYNGLPFAKRHLVKKFGNVSLALALLERDGVLQHYNQLVDKSKGLISQAEHSVIVGKKVTTKIE